jgi:opacity protein-like surface antigen
MLLARAIAQNLFCVTDPSQLSPPIGLRIFLRLLGEGAAVKRLIFGLILAAASFGSTGLVSAADMPVKARPGPAYNPCAVARFTGFYLGGNAGAVAYTASRGDLDGFLTDNGAYTSTKIAPSVGVQVGYDWQSCNKVFGVVADWNWTNAKANTRDEPNDPADPDQGWKSKMHWFSTIRARAGLAVDNTLFYVTGGVAAAKIKTTVTDGSAALGPDAFTFDKTRWGIALGAGAEFALWDNWSLNTELLYMQFQKENETINSLRFGRGSFDLNDSAWVGRIGINYRWDNPRTAYADAAAYPVKGMAPVFPCGPTRFNGFYAGGNAGAVAYTANRNDLDGYLTDNNSYTSTKTAGTGGGQVGWDWQSCHRVFGVVADWNWANAKANTRDEPGNFTQPDQGFKSKLHWFSTIRGRAGLVVDDTLIYVTGGAAVAKIKTTITEGDNILGNEVSTFDDTRWGLVGGVGVEYALWNGWSVNSELLYMQFNKQTVTLNSPREGPPNGFSFDLVDSAWVTRVGLNYRWDNPRDAYAANIPVKAATYPCGPARFNGLYAGGNVGAIAYHANRNDLDGFLTDNDSYDATKTKLTAGAQVGYDWQFCHKVVGVVADWNWTNAEAVTRDDPNNVVFNNTIRSKLDSFGTLRTRTGLAVNDTLVYLTGGLAAAKIHTTVSTFAAGIVNESIASDKTRWGWTGGIGAEFALWSGWSATGEVLYMQFKKETLTATLPINGNVSFDNNDSAWVGRVGLNYRFGDPGKGPVVAKY